MPVFKNLIIHRNEKKSILIDYYYNSANHPLPLVIFAHGYKGFKDWGAWELMATAFANAGFCFLKFNFSHNGGTMEQPIDFPDLEAFGTNNYSKEIEDLNQVIDWSIINLSKTIDTQQIYLIGHSRAGGITTIVASQNKRVKKLVTLASVCDYKSRFPKEHALQEWKENGVYFVKNGRTLQNMPHYYQFFEDFDKNEKALTIKSAVELLDIPHFIIHGDQDLTVPIEEAYRLHHWNTTSQLHIIKAANHTLGAVHPWHKEYMPAALRKAVQCCVNFYNKKP